MKVERPGTALWIYFGIGFLLYMYGIRDGALLIFVVLAGIVIYKMLAPRY